MSTTEEEEHKEVVRRDPPLVTSPNQQATSQTMGRSSPASSTPLERREIVEKRSNTNIGAVVAIAIGILALMFGVFLVYREIPYLPWPYSIVVTMGLGVILLAIGASFISSRTTTTAA
jgi:hypothetical protein